jgi:hypothetical protein
VAWGFHAAKWIADIQENVLATTPFYPAISIYPNLYSFMGSVGAASSRIVAVRFQFPRRARSEPLEAVPAHHCAVTAL